MEERRKRRLLARIEGQLACLERNRVPADLARQRIQRALSLLSTLVKHAHDVERLSGMQRLIDQLDHPASSNVRAHQWMLARVDCLLWQRMLRKGSRLDPGRAA